MTLMLKCPLLPVFQLLSPLGQGPVTLYLVSVNISGCQRCSATLPYKSLFSPPRPPIYTPPVLLLCDVVAQTVKVNHNGLYVYEKKKNTSACLCRCTNLLSKQNPPKPWQKKKKPTKLSERKWRRMCLDFFLVLSWMMDVLWCPKLHPPPHTCPRLLIKGGRGSSLSLSLIGWERQTTPR